LKIPAAAAFAKLEHFLISLGHTLLR
jgi:hypothetical protein